MLTLWERIDQKLEALGAHGSFSPGASATSITAAEALLRLQLPDDLRQSFAIHNGDATRKLDADGWQSDGPFAEIEFLSLGSVMTEWQTWNDLPRPDGFDAVPDGPVQPLWWNPKWVPITTIDGSAWHHCLDLDPPAQGRLGQVIEIIDDECWRRVIAPNYRAFLEQILADLEAGHYHLDEDSKLVHAL